MTSTDEPTPAQGEPPAEETPGPLDGASNETRILMALQLLLTGQKQVIPVVLRSAEAQIARDQAWTEFYGAIRQWITPSGWKELLSTRGGQIIAAAIALAILAATGTAVDLTHLADVAGRAWAGQCVP